MKKKLNIIILALCFSVILGACGKKTEKQVSSPAGEEPLSIVTTIFPVYDFARAVTGSDEGLTMLIKPGAESHSFDPSPADIIAIENADVFIYIGGENDEWVETILGSMDISEKNIVCLMDYVDVYEEEIVEGMEDDHVDDDQDEDDHDDEDEDHDEEPELDEHIWTSPANAMVLVQAIADAIIEADKDEAETYQENADQYISEIEAIQNEFRAVVDEGDINLVIFGDRFPFRYFAVEYGLDYRAAFPGCSTDTEVSAGTLAYLIETVKENNLPYVYYIELSNQNIARTICEETGAEMLQLHSCQSISKDDFEAGETYVSLMTGNIENLRKGLDVQ